MRERPEESGGHLRRSGEDFVIKLRVCIYLCREGLEEGFGCGCVLLGGGRRNGVDGEV